MATPNTGYTLAEMREAVALEGGWDRTYDNWSPRQKPDFALMMKRALNRFNTPITRRGKAYKWNFTRPRAKLTTVAPYATGTVSVTLGVVTLVSGTWPSGAEDYELVVSGGVYTVSTRDSDTQITLDDLLITDISAAEYQLVKAEYVLPDDFGGMDTDFTYQAGDDSYYGPIREFSDDWIQERMQFGNPLVFPPKRFSLVPKQQVTTVGQAWLVRFHPMPSAAFVFLYRYYVSPNTTTTATHYFPGGPQANEALMACLLAEFEKYDKGQPGYLANERDRLMLEAIEHDSHKRPDHLGYDGDQQTAPIGSQDYVSEYPLIGSVTYEGH